MATSTRYAYRRRRALLAAIALAVLLIIIIVLIIASIAKRSGNKGGGTVPTVSPTNNNILLPSPGNSDDVTVNSPGVSTPSVPTPSNTDENVMYVTASTLNVREKAEANAKVVTKLKKDAEVTVLEKGDKFYKIKTSSGQTGYASKDYLTTTKPSNSSTVTATAGATPDTSKSTVKYATRDVRVRKSPDTKNDSNIITTVKKGTKVTAFTTSGGWTYVEYQKGKYGYISDSYLTATAPTTSPTPTAGTATPSPSPAHATDWASVLGSADAGKIKGDAVSDGYLKLTPAGEKGVVKINNLNGYKVYEVKKIGGGSYYIGIKDDKAEFKATMDEFTN